MPISSTPEPPYYAVLFTNVVSYDNAGYTGMAKLMVDLASNQPGFLGVETAGGEIGITIPYWIDLASIAAWRAVSAHRSAQKLGRERWYESFKIRICRVERDYGFIRKARQPGSA